MSSRARPPITAAEVVLPCQALDPAVRFFIDRLGFRLDVIFPADDPAVACMSGHGLRLRLDRGADGPAGTVRIICEDPSGFADGAAELLAPNGTRVIVAKAEPAPVLPPVRQNLVIRALGDDAAWGTGRAGMQYRDLVPDRQGGRFIVSHIRIPVGGPVPDYVHFHMVRFQMIYCYRGWVKVVYEDQGPPFVMQAGDCVLQPPRIRHRVLEASEGLEVIEIGCPAAHPTHVDHDLELPTANLRPQRDFSGQRFVRHQVAKAEWRQNTRFGRLSGFEARDLGIGAATDGLAGVRVLRPRDPAAGGAVAHAGEFQFLFVLNGKVTLRCGDGDKRHLVPGDAVTLPAGLDCEVSDCGGDLEVLDVSLPA